MSSEWYLSLLVMFIVVYSCEWSILLLVVFIAAHVTQIILTVIGSVYCYTRHANGL
jgi:hypothetical protein